MTLSEPDETGRRNLPPLFGSDLEQRRGGPTARSEVYSDYRCRGSTTQTRTFPDVRVRKDVVGRRIGPRTWVERTSGVCLVVVLGETFVTL